MRSEDDATGDSGWYPLVRSIEKHRSYDARFFKPVCLIAAVDAVLEGEISPRTIDPNIVIGRFHSYVEFAYPERAALGWRPFWHLSNDGAWEITKSGRKTTPSDFGTAKKPDSRGQLFQRLDHVAVPFAMLPLWESSRSLMHLRSLLLDMLDRDDDKACQTMATVLRAQSAPASLLPYGPEGTETMIRTRVRRGQGFESSGELRVKIEQRAMAIATELMKCQGWAVQDVAKYESFDLLCNRDGTVVYVEVKGTTGAADRIILTRAEVEFAAANRSSMMLVVVSDIEVRYEHDGCAVACGGIPHAFEEWAPDQRRLQPIAYSYCIAE